MRYAIAVEHEPHNGAKVFLKSHSIITALELRYHKRFLFLNGNTFLVHCSVNKKFVYLSKNPKRYNIEALVSTRV